MFFFEEEKCRKILFKCEDCAMIISAKVTEEEDLTDLENNTLFLKCPCEGVLLPLKD